MNLPNSTFILALLTTQVFLVISCQFSIDGKFGFVKASESGIHFANNLEPNDTLNIINFRYFYNGGGVGIGDFNCDGLPDIYMGGNMVSGEMYLNRGGFRFENITTASGTVTDRWITGVSVVDINQDNLPDLYLGVSGLVENKRNNLLYINQGNNTKGIPVFREMAAEYGLDYNGFTTHAAFFDFDHDQDLDVYLLNAANTEFYGNQIRQTRVDGQALTADKLFENTGVHKNSHPVFKDISKQAGIVKEGFGLGVSIYDFNGDNYPDIYVSNDYLSNDLLYINQQDGTFRDEAGDYFQHLSYFSMGNDVGDINNDGLEDIITLDMLPAHREGQQMMVQPMNEDRFRMALQQGYLPQYMRNTLQLRRTASTESMPVFSEIGQLAGIHHTDWSWAPLLADFDNDGWKDLFVTNGYVKDITNADFVAFDMNEAFQIFNPQERERRISEIYDALPALKRPNYLFRNNQNLSFTNQAASWGLDEISFSQGAAYADFDLDGDLDLVVNNINTPAFLYENLSPQKNYLQIIFERPYAILNSQVEILHNGKQQVQTYSPYRGYQSSVEPLLHFGLGEDTVVAEIKIINPEGKVKVIKNVKSGQRLTIRNEGFQEYKLQEQAPAPLFREVSADLDVLVSHREKQSNILKSERLIPYQYDQQGNALSAADINSDGLEDFFVGGTLEQNALFFYQKADGTFLTDTFPSTKFNDSDALFLDADLDGDFDLYVTSGHGSSLQQDRLYMNQGLDKDGKVEWLLSCNKSPSHDYVSSCLASVDFDRDGDLDVFAGGHVKPGSYPFASPSRILRNEGGNFDDVSRELAPALAQVGIVNDATWADLNQDGWPDLLIAAEWEPLRIFINRKGKLREWKSDFSELYGWWNTIEIADLDADGDLDILAGNLGLNHDFEIKEDYPLEFLVKDFDKNGQPDPIFTAYLENKEGKKLRYPLHNRHELSTQIINIRRRFPRFEDYAPATLPDVFSKDEMVDAYRRKVNISESIILENLGNDQEGMPDLRVLKLPIEAQFAPIHDFLLQDINHDQLPDILCVGNLLSAKVEIGRMDALPGLVLINQDNFAFEALSPEESGFVVLGEGRKIKKVKAANGKDYFIVSQRNGPLLIFTENTANRQLAGNNLK